MRRKLALIIFAALLAVCSGCAGGGVYYNDCPYGDCGYYDHDYYYPYGYEYPYYFEGGEEHEGHESGEMREAPWGGGEREERGFRR